MIFSYALMAILVAGGAYFLGRWFTSARPGMAVKMIKWLLLVVGLVAAVFALVMKRVDIFFFSLFVFLPLLMNLLALRNRAKAQSGPSPGGASEVKTRFLRMFLDHDSGEMDGEVLEGEFQGYWLSALSLQELLRLLAICRSDDPQSAAVLEAFLDRSQGENWRDAQGGGAQASAMGDEEEALNILGLKAGASRDEILDAHRRLMQKVHPDHGGSNYLAAKINQAKDLLLSRFS